MISLRLLEPEDYRRSWEWVNDPENNKYLVTKNATYQECCDFYESAQKNGRMFAIVNEKGLHVGNIKLIIDWKMRKAEVGQLIDKKHWNKGYGSFARKLIIKYAFEVLNLHRVWCGCARGNVGSIRVCQKAGMTQEGILIDDQFVNGKYQDAIRFGITRDDYATVNLSKEPEEAEANT